jgi:hypothetical protein
MVLKLETDAVFCALGLSAFLLREFGALASQVLVFYLFAFVPEQFLAIIA